MSAPEPALLERSYPAPTAESGGSLCSILPGKGLPGKGCGEYRPTHVCLIHLQARVVKHECERRDCPDCAGICEGHSHCPVSLPPHGGGKWSHREAELASRRWEDYIEQNGLERTPIRQVIVSVHPDRFDPDSDHRAVIAKVRSLGERAIRKLAWREMYGGSAVVHLYRGCEKDGYDVWGPHVHVLCFGVDTRKTAGYSRRSHLTIKQVNRAGGGFASYRGFGLMRHLVYELGHSAVVEGGHALSWFGDLKPWKQPPLPPGEAPPCPVCEEPMSPWPWQWVPDPGLGPRSVVFTASDGTHGTISITVVPGPPSGEGA